MKKIILLLGVFLTFGCSAQYDLTIKDDTFEENLTLSSEFGDIETKEELYAQYLDEYPINIKDEFLYYAPTEKLDGVTYYDKSIIETEYGYRANYKAKFDLDEYQDSRLLSNTFKNYNIGYDDENNYYYLIAQNIKLFNYNKSLTNLQINIILEGYEIVESNANNQTLNKLTWNFTNNSFNENDRIILRYREEKKEQVEEPREEPTIENPTKNADSNQDLITVFVGFSAFAILLIGILIFKNKLKFSKIK